MKTNTIFIVLVAILVSFTACKKDIIEDINSTASEYQLTISLPETRTSLGSKKGEIYPVYWDVMDKIVANGNVSDYAKISDNQAKAVFNFANEISYPCNVTYPYTAGSLCSDERPTVIFSAEQYYSRDTFGSGYAPMCGYGDGNGIIEVKHLSGVLRFAITGSEKLSKIEIRAQKDIALAGEFDVNCQTGEITAIEGKVSNKITYIANKQLSTTSASVFYITIPAGNLGMCDIFVTDSNGTPMKLTWNGSNVKPGIVRELKEFTFDTDVSFEIEGMTKEEDELIVKYPTNVIYYTSSNGKVVEPDETDVFGANIVSNTYENGNGVIRFDAPVASIGDFAFYYCSSLTSVTIPDSVTSIGYGAFYYCAGLTSVTIGNSVTSIGDYAFSSCSSLTSVTIPDSVTSIGYAAFKSCTSLTSVTIGDSVTSIGENAFNNCSGLTSITIPDSVTSIGYGAFFNCSSLTEITIPDSIISIEADTFRSCTSLAVVNIPDSITSIGGGAFQDCTNLSSITIPHNVTTIGSLAFMECDLLMEIYCKPTTPPSIFYLYQEYEYRDDVIITNGSFPFNNGMKIYVPHESFSLYTQFSSSANGNVDQTNWSKYKSYITAYDYSKGETVEIKHNNEILYTSSDGKIVNPNKTNVFGANIVSNIYEDGKGIIKFDGDVTSIGDRAFLECHSLTSITIPNSATSIKSSAFHSCSSLTSITIPNSVTSIGDSAFYYCVSLTSVIIPDSITSIGSSAFFGCNNLTSVALPNSVTSIGYKAFSSCSRLQAFYSKYASSDNRCLVIDGVLNSFAPSGLTSYTIPNSVTSIENFAFFYCNNLTSITIPDSVTSIGENAFSYCRSLTSVYCKPTAPPVGNYYMFYLNASGRKIYVPRNSVDAYKSAWYWSDYASDIVGYDF